MSSGFHSGLHGRGANGAHYRGAHGSHSSSHRLHKSVRFATTIDDGGQRTGARGRYSPPPSPPRSVGRVGREAREDTPPGSRGTREDTPPAPGGSVDSARDVPGDAVEAADGALRDVGVDDTRVGVGVPVGVPAGLLGKRDGGDLEKGGGDGKRRAVSPPPKHPQGAE